MVLAETVRSFLVASMATPPPTLKRRENKGAREPEVL